MANGKTDFPSFLSPSSHEIDFGGSLGVVRFYAASPGPVLEMRSLLQHVAPLLSILLNPSHGSMDADAEEEVMRESGEGGGFKRIVKNRAASPEVIRMRLDEYERATEKLLKVADQATMRILAKLLMNSMRDLPYPREKGRPNDTDADAFLETVDIVTLAKMLGGVREANKELFLPLERKIAEARAKAEATAKARMRVVDKEDAPPEPSSSTSAPESTGNA